MPPLASTSTAGPASPSLSRAVARSTWYGALIALLALAAQPLLASEWRGGSANWSDVYGSGSGGWQDGVPNGTGSTARLLVGSASFTTTNNLSSLTVGSILLQGTSVGTWTISTPTAITLNRNGATSGGALLTNSGTGSLAQLLISGSGSLALADDLDLTNSSASLASTGAIRITVPITGTGNVTISNTRTSLNNTTGTVALTGANTFTGSVTVKSGTTAVSSSTAFGQSTNVVTVGVASAGNASIYFTSTSAPANNFVITAGTAGTNTFATTSNGVNLTGTILLNGDLATRVGSGTFTLSGVISGAGRLTHAGSAILALSGANTYTGGTTISGGTINLSGSGKLGAGTTSIASGATLSFSGLAGNPYAFASGDTLTGSGSVALATSAVTFSGLLSPGTSGMGALTLSSSNSSGTLQFDATTRFAFTLGASGTNTSLLLSSGNPTLGLGSGVVNFDDFSFTTGTGFAAGNSYTLISGATTHTGDLGSSLSGLIDSSSLGTLSLSGNDLVLTISAIPEPSTYAAIFGGVALVGAIALKRRKRAA